MSISSEITRINGNIASAYTAVSGKGGTLPSARNSANLPAAIASIPSGKQEQAKTLTLGAAAPFTVTPDSGKVLSSVPVVLDTSVIKAENIAKDVTMLGVTGTHEGGGGGGGHVVTCDYITVDSSDGFVKFLKSDGTLITYDDYTRIANVSESDVIAIFITCKHSYAYVKAESDNATFSYIMQVKNSQSTGSSNSIEGDEYVTLIVLPSEDTHFTGLTSIR